MLYDSGWVVRYTPLNSSFLNHGLMACFHGYRSILLGLESSLCSYVMKHSLRCGLPFGISLVIFHRTLWFFRNQSRFIHACSHYDTSPAIVWLLDWALITHKSVKIDFQCDPFYRVAVHRSFSKTNEWTVRNDKAEISTSSVVTHYSSILLRH